MKKSGIYFYLFYGFGVEHNTKLRCRSNQHAMDKPIHNMFS